MPSGRIAGCGAGSVALLTGSLPAFLLRSRRAEGSARGARAGRPSAGAALRLTSWRSSRLAYQGRRLTQAGCRRP